MLLLHVTFACAFLGMQSNSLKLFANVDQKPMLLKRQAFAMFSGEVDQYHLYLPLIQGSLAGCCAVISFCTVVQAASSTNCVPCFLSERLTDTLRMNPTAAISAQIFLMFRVLLLRISSHHLTSLWPIMVTELVRFPSFDAKLTLHIEIKQEFLFFFSPDSNLYTSREDATVRERHFKVSW